MCEYVCECVAMFRPRNKFLESAFPPTALLLQFIILSHPPSPSPPPPHFPPLNLLPRIIFSSFSPAHHHHFVISIHFIRLHSMMASRPICHHSSNFLLSHCCRSASASSISASFLLILFTMFLFAAMPTTSNAYFVLTRYSALPRSDADELGTAAFSNTLPRNWATGADGFDGGDNSLDALAEELGIAEWMRPLPLLSSAPAPTKRSAGAAKTLAGHEHVCKTIIRTDFRPTHGHEQNGTRVEIQQDGRRQFSATFVECENTKREHCHGIDNAMFSSECVTVYEFRPAGVRLEGSADDFVEGLVKIPITCQCRLRRKIGNGILPNL